MKRIENQDYCTFLPRRIKRGICQSLDDTGDKCKNKGTIETYYFGDDNAKITNVGWVAIILCDKCAGQSLVKEAEIMKLMEY